MESWFQIKQDDFHKNYGLGLFDKYNNSTNLILTSLYPEHENLKMFGSFQGTTTNGKLKVECWSRTNKKQPHEVALHCRDKFEFICDACHHPFDSSLDNIVKGSWCPYCANKQRCDDTKSCQTCLAKTFHSFDGKTPNGNLKVQCWSKTNKKEPHEVALHCRDKFEFICDACHHPFDSLLGNIVKGSWCPYCANPPKKLCDDTLSCQSCSKKTFHSFDGKTPNGNKVLDCWNKENPKKPHEEFMCSGKKYKFNCDSCPHSFDSKLSNIVKGQWCPYCANQKRCDDTLSCQSCLKKTFHSFDGKTSSGKLKVECWSKTNVKQPHEVFMSISKHFDFICDICYHSFSTSLNDIVSGGNWCPYCANLKRCDDTLSCKTCLTKTFQSFDGKTPSGNLKIDCWSKRNKKQPHEVALHCNGKFEFICDACHHLFDSSLDNIVKGKWCPYCVNQKLCDDTLFCKTCLEKTFHSFDGKTPSGTLKVDCWHDDNPKKPHEEFMCSGKKYKFNCDACPHTFDSSLANIVNGKWCPTCKNKTEKLVLEFLQNKFSKKDVKHQFKHEKVKNIRELPFDICLLPHKIIIEVDGMQHFKNHCHFKSHAVEQCERDCGKMTTILEEGYSVIRIVQQEVWFEKTRDAMLNKLKKSIQECVDSDFPIIRYISMDENIYMNHKQLLSER